MGWLHHPAHRRARLGAACFFIVGGLLSILPVLGLRMLPLGLALLSKDVPRMKPWLERTARRIEAVWRRVRGRRSA